MVTVRGDNVRALESISLDLSGARVDFLRRPPRPQATETKPALFANELSVQARPFSILGSEIAFELNASAVELEQAKQPDDKLLLLLRRAASGHVCIEAARDQLERLLTRAAEKLAQKQGVTIESVQLHLAQSEPRTLEAKITVAARKLLFRPILNLAGTVAISDELAVTISNLSCHGDGPIAALACAAITPQFRRIEQRPFPLSAFPIGEVQLHDVELQLTENRVTIAAKFGQQSART